MKYIRGFFAFWYDFIVGDAWEVAAGIIAGLILIFLATHYGGAPMQQAAAFVFPVLIVALLTYSLWRVRGTGS